MKWVTNQEMTRINDEAELELEGWGESNFGRKANGIATETFNQYRARMKAQRELFEELKSNNLKTISQLKK